MNISLKDPGTQGLANILLVMLIWGSAFTATKIAVEEVTPFMLAFLRNGIASVCLLPFFLVKIRQATRPLPYVKMSFMGLTGITLFYAFFNSSLVYTTAAAGALVQGILPVAIALPAVLFLRERLTRTQALGIVLSVAGVVLVGFTNGHAAGRNPLLGSVLMILSVFSWTVYTILSRSIRHIDPVLVTAFSTFAGTVLLLPALALEPGDHIISGISWKGWAAIAYLGLFASALSYILYNKALQLLPAAQVGAFLNLDPVIGAVIAIIFLREKVTGWQIAGGLLVLAGLWLSSKTAGEKARD
ncbi:DMT family transporter [Chitinophaga japonensis]|uniref:Drug/metabolite transporter (DMT)-like permease n=1 Tax=Chitinophaga japonensis TaxID=104662 RepID=A0A562SSK9_CHIJA|nr:DMT family transporter [Chitinophaga japonensis]TWI84088.1 drug/metabolite transporter (DMT)-like permease [Chitinophaga japonensis]